MNTALLDTPGCLAIVLCAFGAVITAGTPSHAGLTAVRSAVGLSAVLSLVVPSATAGALVMLGIGTAVGIDNSVFRLRRESEKQAKLARRPGAHAVDTTRTTTGQSVLVCCAAGVVSMAVLHIAISQAFTSIAGRSTAVVVAVAVAGALPTMPALLNGLRTWFAPADTRRPRTRALPHQPQTSLLLSAVVLLALTFAAIGG
ncbi:hypothetical protein [Umezawaea sp.]|uniref:hypothetical protein n=1 Tax=Umezawaea sp. TaxID=1955258 RepID=UPI002ED42D64